MLKRGANLSLDRIGMTKLFFDDQHWIDIVKNAIDKGYVNQIMLSHDAAIFVYGLEGASGEDVFDDYTYVSRVFLPKLQQQAGVTDEQLSIMFEENPKRVLTFRK